MASLATAHARHRAARDALLRAARAVPRDRWLAPRAPGKWSAAEICEHLALADAAALQELAGGAPMRARVPAWKATLFRWTVLPWIIATGRFPPGVPAPREIRPAAPPDREGVLARLADGGPRIERALDAAARDGVVRFTHPYFGRIGPRRALRLLARHIEHHVRQLEAAR